MVHNFNFIYISLNVVHVLVRIQFYLSWASGKWVIAKTVYM